VDAIVAWWQHWPLAMIGAPVPDSLVVLDIDPRNGGSYEALTDVLGPLPETLTAWSGRNDGGRHLYFARPPGVLSSSRLPEGIDLKRAERGYCIVPPSVHPATGMAYRWEGDTAAALPWRAREALRPPRSQLAPMRRLVAAGAEHPLVSYLDRFAEDGIQNALYWAACRADQEGCLDELEPLLAATATRYGCPGAAATVASARNRDRTKDARKGAGR
jgi:hypothetical protein